MLKPKLFILYLFILTAANAAAQDMQKYYSALSVISSHYSPYSSVVIKGFLQSDSLILRDVRSSAEIELFIKAGGQNKIYGIELNNFGATDLAEALNLLQRCSNLEYLKLSNISEKLPNEISQLQPLKGIEFSFSNSLDMSDALKKISALKNLCTLIYSDHKLELPANIASLTQIKTVHLSTLNINRLDISKTNWQAVYITEDRREMEDNQNALLALSKVKTLRALDIQNIKLKDTLVIGKFKQLTSLQVEGWTFEATPLANKIGQLQNLQSVALLFPFDKTLTIAGLKPLANLKSLTINSQFNSRLSPEMEIISSFKHLEMLSLPSCGLYAIPDIFDKLPELKTLSLKNNRINTLPASLFYLSKLENLDISFNELDKLPEAYQYTLPSLKRLNLRNNFLTSLPPAITRLYSLETTDLSYNRLRSLPDGWQNLYRLKYVDVSFNDLADYPTALKNNSNIKFIAINPPKPDGATLKQFRLAKLLENITNDNNRENWKGIVDSANKAILLDSAAYVKYIDWETVGIARYKTGDYQKAANDLALAITHSTRDAWSIINTGKFKVKAHLAIAQVKEAADTYIYLDKTFWPQFNGLQQAAVLYLTAGNKNKFKELIKATADRSKHELNENATPVRTRATKVLDYAEILIMAGRATDATNLLKTDTAAYTYAQQNIKEYLLAVAQVVNKPNTFNTAKAGLTAFMRNRFKINVWEFATFNSWLQATGIKKAEQNNLHQLQDLVEQKY